MYVAIGKIFLGWAIAVAGTSESGIGLLRQGLRDYRATGTESWAPYYGALLAERLGRVGSTGKALTVLHEAQRSANRAADHFFWEPEMRRLEGELCLSSHSIDAANAEEKFLRAITTARERHAKSLELRASTSLARLWRDEGKRTEARDLLAPIYGWFTEGFDTPDLKEAKALLEELA